MSFTLFDQNVLMLIYIYLTAQLQHSEIWIPFTGVWGRLFMSPAHHQLHHSADPAHFNCNLGASLAMWDWLAGSLRMPTVEPPRLAFGVSGHAHDPHGVMGLVVDPVVNAFRALDWATRSSEDRGGSRPAGASRLTIPEPTAGRTAGT